MANKINLVFVPVVINLPDTPTVPNSVARIREAIVQPYNASPTTAPE